MITPEGAVAERLRRLHGISVEVTGGDETIFSIDVRGDGRTLRLIRAAPMDIRGIGRIGETART